MGKKEKSGWGSWKTRGKGTSITEMGGKRGRGGVENEQTRQEERERCKVGREKRWEGRQVEKEDGEGALLFRCSCLVVHNASFVSFFSDPAATLEQPSASATSATPSRSGSRASRPFSPGAKERGAKGVSATAGEGGNEVEEERKTKACGIYQTVSNVVSQKENAKERHQRLRRRRKPEPFVSPFSLRKRMSATVAVVAVATTTISSLLYVV